MDLKTAENPNTQSRPNVDGDKSAFEKFEIELKNTVFGVLFVLLKEEEGSIWISSLFVFIEFFQILGFTFSAEVISSLSQRAMSNRFFIQLDLVFVESPEYHKMDAAIPTILLDCDLLS